jgi:DNA polymerase-3 subunit epsilon
MSYITVVAFDTETTGLEADSEEILEIAANRFTFSPADGAGFKSVEVGKFQSLVKPKKKIPAFITQINNISNEMVKDAPDLLPVLLDFIRFCGPSSILVAHNASFDAAFVGKAVRRLSMPMPLNPIFDSLKMIKKIMPEFRSYKLVEVAKRLQNQTGVDLDLSKLHRAEYDGIVLREVFCACLRKRYQCSDLLQDRALKNLISVHGKPLFFPDFA